MVKSIKVDDNVYKSLNRYAGLLREKFSRHVSINEAIISLLPEKKSNIMNCAGLWKISEKEAEELINHVMEHRRSWKPRY